MATLNEITDKIRNLMSSNDYNQNFLSKELLKFSIINWRSTFIRRDVKNNSNISRLFYQRIPCIEMKCIDDSCSEFNCYDFPMIKSVDKIPEVLRLRNFSFNPLRVSSTDSLNTLPVVQLHELIWTQYNNFTSQNVRAFIKDGYIYIINDSAIENLTVEGVFKNPRELQRFNDEDGNPLYTDDEEFPFPEDMIEGLIKIILEHEFQINYAVPVDNPKETLSKSPKTNTNE